MNKKTINNLKKLSVATITMQLLKNGFRNSAMTGVKPLNLPTIPIIGPAYTLRFIPGREDLSSPEVLGNKKYCPRLAIENVPPNSILVIDGRQKANIAVLGDILIERLKFRGAAGIVTDGGVRDLEQCLLADFPIYAAGAAAPASITGHAAGDLQSPIGCGGIAVLPNDLIIGDRDGIAVVPAKLVNKISVDGLEQERFERYAKMQIKNGASVIGTYPPNSKMKLSYQNWIKKGEPNL